MIYKSIYYYLYRSIEKLGGGNYHIRTNGLLSIILSLIFASALSIYIQVSGHQIRYSELLIIIFVTGCFIGNLLLFGRRGRDIEEFQDLKRKSKIDRFGRLMTLITIMLAIATITTAIII